MRLVERILLVLEALAEDSAGNGVGSLADRVELPPSTVHRILQDLVEHGLVQRAVHSPHYSLGPAVLRFGNAYLRQHNFVRVAQSALHELRARTSESAFLTELVNDDAMCVAMAESPRPLKYFIQVGHRMPYHSSASARAILAFQPVELAERLIVKELSEGVGMYPTTSATPSTVAAVLAELEKVRNQGYAVCDEEMEVGVTALSAPVRDSSTSVVGSITVVAPAIRMRAPGRDRAIELVRESAMSISSALGYNDPGSRAG